MLMQGLITVERQDLDPAVLPFAKAAQNEIKSIGLHEGATLAEVVSLLINLGGMYALATLEWNIYLLIISLYWCAMDKW